VGGEGLAGLLHGEVEDLGDVEALVADLEGLAPVAFALAHVAGDVDVGEEVHFDSGRGAASLRGESAQAGVMVGARRGERPEAYRGTLEGARPEYARQRARMGARSRRREAIRARSARPRRRPRSARP
jgi:hypothetical protein